MKKRMQGRSRKFGGSGFYDPSMFGGTVEEKYTRQGAPLTPSPWDLKALRSLSWQDMGGATRASAPDQLPRQYLGHA
jgi:hypothetical protein